MLNPTIPIQQHKLKFDPMDFETQRMGYVL